MDPTTTVASASLSADTGPSSTDFVTNTSAQTVNGTLSASLVAGEFVEVSIDGGASWSTATSVLGASTWSISTTLSGSHTLEARVSNGSGSSTPYTHTYTLDTTAPTVTFSSPAFSADTGASNADFITKVAAQTITATLSSALTTGEVVYGSLDNGASWTDISSRVSGTALTWNGVTLGGSNTLKLKVQDLAGNDGAVSSHAYVLDTTPPTATFSNLAFSADSGSSSVDFITNTAAQTVGATLSNGLAAGEVVYGSLDNGSSWTNITSKVSGTELTWNGVTLSGSNTLQLKVQDLAGNDGTVISQAYVLDTTAPTMSISSDLAQLKAGEAATFTFTASENITGFTTGDLVVSGGTLSAFSGSGQTYTATFTPTAASSGQGTVSVAAGSFTDSAGNAGAAASLSIPFDTLAPAISNVAVPADGTYAIGQALDFTVNLSESVTVDTTNGTPSLALTLDTGGTVRANYLSGSGSTALVFRYIVTDGNADLDGIALGSALSLNGGTLRDGDGNDLSSLALVSVASTSGVNVNGIAPVFASAAVNGNSLVIEYTEATALDAVHGPATTDYSVLVAGVANAVTGLVVDSVHNTVTLTLATAVSAGQAVTVAYTDPTSGNDSNALQNTVGNDAATFGPTAVTNDTPPPSTGGGGGGGGGGVGVVITAPAQGGTLNGSPYNDTLTGQAGKDIFYPNGGSDTVDGGAGVDTVVFSGARSQYTLTHNSDGGYTVQGLLDPSVSVAMQNIERLHFSDQALALDVTPVSAELATLYHLAFGRNPDDAGWQYHVGTNANGASPSEIISSFVASAEFASGYGQLSDSAFLAQLYSNAFERAPDADGLAYWQQQLANKPSAEGRAQVLEGFLLSEELSVQLTGQVTNGVALLLDA